LGDTFGLALNWTFVISHQQHFWAVVIFQKWHFIVIASQSVPTLPSLPPTHYTITWLPAPATTITPLYINNAYRLQ